MSVTVLVLPEAMLLGETDTIECDTLNGPTVIVKLWEVEVPPPGLTTVTLAAPSSAMSEAGTVAVNSVELTNVVVKATPFQSMVAPFSKLLPVAVSVKLLPPSPAEVGLIELRVGMPETSFMVIYWPSTVMCAVRAAPLFVAKEKLITPPETLPMVSQL